MAKGTAAGARQQFSSVSRNKVDTSSTKTSVIPTGRGGGKTIVGSEGAKGMLSHNRVGGGTRAWSGLRWGWLPDQSGSCNNSLAKSVIISLIEHQEAGQLVPPKERRSII